MPYLDKHCIHVHFDFPTLTNEENIKEAKFIWESIQNVLRKNTKDKFYTFFDLSNSTADEPHPLELLQIYREMLFHPQLGAGVAYGFKPSLLLNFTKLFILMLNLVQDINITETFAEAIDCYTKWHGKHYPSNFGHSRVN